MTSRDLELPKCDPDVTSIDRKSPGSGCRRLKTRIYSTFHFLQQCSSQWEAVRDTMWRHVTGSDPEVTSFNRKSPGSGCRTPKTRETVHFIFYKAVPRSRRQWRDSKWLHVTSDDRKWPASDSFDRKSPVSCCRRPKTHVYCTFHVLQRSSSQ